jgi:hypothetical protein
MTSPVLVAATSPVAAKWAATVPVITTISNLATETHPPKPYDFV